MNLKNEDDTIDIYDLCPSPKERTNNKIGFV